MRPGTLPFAGPGRRREVGYEQASLQLRHREHSGRSKPPANVINRASGLCVLDVFTFLLLAGNWVSRAKVQRCAGDVQYGMFLRSTIEQTVEG